MMTRFFLYAVLGLLLTLSSCKDESAVADYATEVSGVYTSFRGDKVEVKRTGDNQVEIGGEVLNETHTLTITNKETVDESIIYQTSSTGTIFTK